jgi:hypothetical protein
MNQLEVFGFLSIFSQSLAIASASFYAFQVAVTPDNVWMPVGVVFGIVVFAVWTTVRVVRIFDSLVRDVKNIKKHLGLPDEDK